MNLVCPRCMAQLDLIHLEATAELAELADVAARLGSAWRLANEYVQAFRAGADGCVRIAKRLRLLREVARLWERCEFDLDGKRFRTDHGRILAGLTLVCNMDKHSLPNHNYLKKVLSHDAERVSAEGMTAKEEAGREEGRRLKVEGRRGEGGGGAMSAEEYKARAGIESLAGRIGQGMG
jgi:hypothetical protein